MTFRLSIVAAVLLVSATTALASPAPSSTDEARALAGRMQPTPALPSALASTAFPTSTDEARALNANRRRAAESTGAQKAAVACHHSCACSRG